jgi:hypothetical protein
VYAGTVKDLIISNCQITFLPMSSWGYTQGLGSLILGKVNENIVVQMNNTIILGKYQVASAIGVYNNYSGFDALTIKNCQIGGTWILSGTSPNGEINFLGLTYKNTTSSSDMPQIQDSCVIANVKIGTSTDVNSNYPIVIRGFRSGQCQNCFTRLTITGDNPIYVNIRPFSNCSITNC